MPKQTKRFWFADPGKPTMTYFESALVRMALNSRSQEQKYPRLPFAPPKITPKKAYSILAIANNPATLFKRSRSGVPVLSAFFNSKTMKLYLGNLPFSASDDDIREAFSAYGTIEDLFIPLDRETNRPRGFAFITLADDDLARKAIEEMDGSDLQGRNLRVNEAEERRPQQNRGGGGGYGGDRRGGGGGDRRGGGGRGGRDRRGGGGRDNERGW
jgi:uncharacterized membrane protein YgcG